MLIVSGDGKTLAVVVVNWHMKSKSRLIFNLAISALLGGAGCLGRIELRVCCALVNHLLVPAAVCDGAPTFQSKLADANLKIKADVVHLSTTRYESFEGFVPSPITKAAERPLSPTDPYYSTRCS
jgi:hypothetical protein